MKIRKESWKEMNKGKYINMDSVCLECGNVFSIQRRNLKGIGYIEKGYCFDCKKIANHYVVHDVNAFLWKHGDDSDELTQEVVHLLKERENGSKERGNGVYQKILTKQSARRGD